LLQLARIAVAVGRRNLLWRSSLSCALPQARIEDAYGKPDHVHEATMRDVYGNDTSKPDEKTGQKNISYRSIGLSFALDQDKLYSIRSRYIRESLILSAEVFSAGGITRRQIHRLTHFFGDSGFDGSEFHSDASDAMC
jgi:hypothetical protein